MPCYSPLTAYNKGKKPNGKKDLTFQKPSAYMEEVQIPCGQCIGCRLKHAQKWAIRCDHEMQLHDNNCFVTLTYNDESLPNDYSLIKPHLQKFFKRLRKAIHPKKISFFACGEYGETTWRPHYHAIIFGYDFPDKQSTAFSENKNPYYISAELSGLWKQGNHIIAEANYTTAAYVAQYIIKKQKGETAEDYYTRTIIDWNDVTGEINYLKEDTKLEPEFAQMSRNPAIGKNWFNKYKTDCFPSDYLILNGNKVPIPDYYNKLYENEETHKYELTKFKRKMSYLLSEDKPTLKRLREIENVKKLQLKTKEKI